MFEVPNKHRERTHPLLSSTDAAGNNGLFKLSFKGYVVFCVASDGAGWEHVSVTIDRKRCPGWETMCFVKKTFWGKEDIVIQFHPSESQYINVHPYCLHLWRPLNQQIISPPTELIGYQDEK